MATLTLEVPDDLLSPPLRSPEEIARELRLAAAISWYQRGELSHEMAARVAGLDRTDFIDAPARARVEAFHVDIDDLREELRRDDQADRGRLAPDLPEPARCSKRSGDRGLMSPYPMWWPASSPRAARTTRRSAR